MATVQYFHDIFNRYFSDQAVVTVGIDFILENDKGEILYLTRAVEPYKGFASLPGTVTKRPRTKVDATDVAMMDLVLWNELKLRIRDIATPKKLSWTYEWFPPTIYDEQTRRRLTSMLKGIATSDESEEPELGRVSVSICAVSKLNKEAVRKIQIDPKRYSKMWFSKEVSSDLGDLFRRQLEIYQYFGSYDKIPDVFKVQSKF